MLVPENGTPYVCKNLDQLLVFQYLFFFFFPSTRSQLLLATIVNVAPEGNKCDMQNGDNHVDEKKPQPNQHEI